MRRTITLLLLISVVAAQLGIKVLAQRRSVPEPTRSTATTARHHDTTGRDTSPQFRDTITRPEQKQEKQQLPNAPVQPPSVRDNASKTGALPDWIVAVTGIAALLISVLSYRVAKQSHSLATNAVTEAKTANRLSSDANNLSNQSNTLAHQANATSVEANRIATESNEYARQANKLASGQGVFAFEEAWREISDIDTHPDKIVVRDAILGAYALRLTANLWLNGGLDRKMIYDARWPDYKKLYEALDHVDYVLKGTDYVGRDLLDKNIRQTYEEMRAFEREQG